VPARLIQVAVLPLGRSWAGAAARRRPPLWAIGVLQEALRSRARTMLESVEELEAEKQKRLTGQ